MDSIPISSWGWVEIIFGHKLTYPAIGLSILCFLLTIGWIRNDVLMMAPLSDQSTYIKNKIFILDSLLTWHIHCSTGALIPRVNSALLEVLLRHDNGSIFVCSEHSLVQHLWWPFSFHRYWNWFVVHYLLSNILPAGLQTWKIFSK